MSDSPYDGLIFEMEHNPYDVTALGDALQYMLSRKQIAESGSVAPKVTPIARIPANGAEMNQSLCQAGARSRRLRRDLAARVDCRAGL